MLALCNIRLDCGLNLTAPPSCQRHDILITPHSQCGVDEAREETACRRHATINDNLQIHRDIPFVLAGADVQKKEFVFTLDKPCFLLLYLHFEDFESDESGNTAISVR